MTINLKQQIGNNKIVIVVMPNEKYTEDLIEIAKDMSLDFKRPCIVNLNRPYTALTESFRRYGIDDRKFFFIDGITKIATEKAEEIKNAVFLTEPNALTELSLTINEIFKTFKPEILIFDSLSTLLIYENISTIMKFVHNLIGKIRLSSCTTIFTALEGDAETQLINDLKSFVDKIIKL